MKRLGTLIALSILLHVHPSSAQSFFSIENIDFLVDISSRLYDVIRVGSAFEPDPVTNQMQMDIPRHAAAHGHIQMNAFAAFPVGIAQNNFSSNGFGFGGEFILNVQGPFFAGVAVNGVRFDSESTEYSEVFSGELFRYDEMTASRALFSHAVARFEPDVRGRVRPYLQGLFGAHWYYTNTRIRDIDANERVDGFKELSNVVVGFGGQAGAQIFPCKSRLFGIDVRVGYLFNPSVEYLVDAGRPIGQTGYPIDYFEDKSSSIQMMSIQIGAFLKFWTHKPRR